MHRHGYKGKKFNRERDQRRALLKNLAGALIEHGSITTTLPKAKETRPYVEKLITKAKKGSLSNQRQIMAALNSPNAVQKLFSEVVPSTMDRTSGYLRIKKGEARRGDNTVLATISFVDEIKKPQATKKKKSALKTQKVAAKTTDQS